MDDATRRYLRSVHHISTGVRYSEGGASHFAKNVFFFHTKGWGDRELIAAIKARHPTWEDIDLVVPATFTPASDAVVPRRDPELEARIAET